MNRPAHREVIGPAVSVPNLGAWTVVVRCARCSSRGRRTVSLDAAGRVVSKLRGLTGPCRGVNRLADVGRGSPVWAQFTDRGATGLEAGLVERVRWACGCTGEIALFTLADGTLAWKWKVAGACAGHAG